jgi:glycosyltransferase involved in cell wall biosynthesis
MDNNNDPLVSICCLTFNQVSYIRQCLDGFMMQKTDFPFEVLIHDDASTDGTSDIIREYETKYPDVIRPIYQIENQYSKGVRGIMAKYNFPRAQGKYIALCEGDDYWTDPLKLQKQFDFLEKHPQYSFCFHNAITFYVNKGISVIFNKKLKTKEYNTNDLLFKNWFIPTASLFIRKDKLPQPFPEWFSKIYNGDLGLELLLSTQGNFFCINEPMSVYRKNAIGSLSVNGLKGTSALSKLLFLLKCFKESHNKNNFATNFAILRTKIKIFRFIFFKKFLLIERLKNKILYGEWEVEI